MDDITTRPQSAVGCIMLKHTKLFELTYEQLADPIIADAMSIAINPQAIMDAKSGKISSEQFSALVSKMVSRVNLCLCELQSGLTQVGVDAALPPSSEGQE